MPLKRYLHLLGYAAPYRRGWLLIVSVTLLSTALSLLQPWPMKIVIDHVLAREPVSDTLAKVIALLPGGSAPEGLLGWMVLATLAFFALNSAAEVILTRSWIQTGQGMVYDLSSDLFAHLQRQSLFFHSRNFVGDAMSRITTDSWSVYTLADTMLIGLGRALVMIVGIVTVMARLDLGLTLLSFTIAPFLVWTSFLIGRTIRAVARETRESESRIQSQVQRTLSGMSVVQAFGQEGREQLRFENFTTQAIRAKQRGTLVGGLYGLSSGLVTTFGTVLILWVGARHVLGGSLMLGTLLVFLAYLQSLQMQMSAFTAIYNTLQTTSARVDRVMEILEAEPEIKEKPGAGPLPEVQGHVRLENVTFGYEPGRPVLHDISLDALPGETIAIVGATGAGKSTLVSLVPRFFDPWSGRVTIDGHDVKDVQLKSLRHQISLVLQEPFLFPISIAENIAYGRPDASREEIEAAARAANAHLFIEQLPQGYETIVGERGSTLSGGERQRLSIARALLKNAPVLILDEPTSALDAETEGLLLQALDHLMRGRTTFIIAHRLSTIRNADKIVVLKDGAIVESGTHTELLKNNHHYARLHSAQFAEHHQNLRAVV